MEAIVSLLVNSFPEFAVVITLTILSWFASRKFTKMEERFDKIENSVSGLKLDVVSLKEEMKDVRKEVNDIRKEVNDFRKEVNDVREDVKDIQMFIISKFPSAIDSFAFKRSPLALTELGEKLYKECGGEEFLNANQEMLFKKISERNPKTALDVEMYAKEALVDVSTEDIFSAIKVWVYNSPAWKIKGNDYAISIFDVYLVIGIPLRDRYLEVHPEVLR